MTGNRSSEIRFAASLLLLLIFKTVVAYGQPAIAAPYTGQPVYAVIDSIRQQGYPIAYSSQLVPRSMRILEEPQSTDPIELVAEILKPHHLLLKSEDGFYLVVRDKIFTPGDATGTLLLMVRNQASQLLKTPVNIRGSPPLPMVESLGQGVFQYTGLAAGKYTLNITAFGYEPQTHSIEVRSMDVDVLSVNMQTGIAELEELTVSTSRYLLFANSQFFVDQRAIENLPDIGDDPIRSVHRLPGVAAGGWSAKSYFRGGEENETAIYLNGLKLLDPFHVRDYQNVFSSIDARSISGVEAYTGGFPANYGDRMSGLLLLESQLPDAPRHTELGISVFNTSILTSGYTDDGKFDWLLSARNSNLKYILNKDLGRPSYNDIFISAGFNPSADSRLTFNALRADDSILVVTESAPEELEQSKSATLNQSFWLTLENQWTPDLTSITVLSASIFSNERDAIVLDPGQLVGQVMDDREVDIYALKQDWGWRLNQSHYLQFGFELRHQSAKYRYTSKAEYFDFYLAYPGVQESIERDISAEFDGQSYALFVSDRIEVTEYTSLELGFRWDKQSYQGPLNDDQFSPRISLFHSVGPRADLRLSWGRYHQSQGIHELQVEDGVEHFFPAQRADHLIGGIHYRFGDRFRLRAEVYQKTYQDLRPRFENLQDSLALIPELEPDRARIAPDSARARGIELTLENRGNTEFDWWTSYTFSRVTDSIDARVEKRNWDQQHALQAGMAWHKGPWELGLAANIHSGWPTTGLTLVYDPDSEDEDAIMLQYGSRNAENFGIFASIDFRVSREWTLDNSRISAFFEISNAVNRKNECCIDYDIEDEDAEVLILEESIDHWLPILPAIGLLWEF